MENLGWFTGVMEDEGSISAQVYTLPDGRVRLTPFICLVNTDQGILDECFATMVELTNDERSGPRICGHSGTNRPCTTIRLDGPGIKPVLLAMLPHMRGEKRRNAEVMLEFIESRSDGLFERDALGRVRRNGYTVREVELISSIRTHKVAKSFEAICEAPNVS
jgi:hypothetical protein